MYVAKVEGDDKWLPLVVFHDHILGSLLLVAPHVHVLVSVGCDLRGGQNDFLLCCSRVCASVCYHCDQ